MSTSIVFYAQLSKLWVPEKVLAENPDEYAVVKLMPQVYEAVQAVVEEKINAFGSAGKAVL